MSLNHVTLMGRLTKDPELRYTKSEKAVASFTLAVDRDGSGDKQTDFVSCVAWSNTAIFIDNYFSKGSPMALVGRLQSRKWQDKNGNDRITWEVVADRVYFAGSKADNHAEPSGFTPIGDEDGELPF